MEKVERAKTVEEIKKARAQIEEKRNEIRYITESFQIRQLVEKFNDGVFDIPEYQRKFVWDENPKLKHKLIESLLLGLPIPVMFFAEIETDDGKTLYEIVDGAQRMQTLEQFYDEESGFCLESLEQLTDLNGFYYSDLPTYYQNKLDNTFMRVVILEIDTNEETKQELFYRLNTNFEKANQPEVLRGRYPDVFNFLTNLADDKKFQIICPISEKKVKRFEREDLILRFFAYLNAYDMYDGEVSVFLEDFCKKMNEVFKDEKTREETQDTYRLEFENMIDFVDRYFDYGFRKTKTSSTTPRTRFEAISVGVGLALRENANLVPDRAYIRAWLDHADFKKHTTTHAANNKSRLVGRVEYVCRQLLEGARL